MPLVEYLEIEALVHATEDPSRVRRALRNLLPREERSEARIQEITLTGHYGNPIILMRMEFTSKKAENIIRYVASRLSEEDRKKIARTLDLRIDEERNLYLRISKQCAYLDELMLDEGGDVIRLKVKLASSADPKIICKELGLIP